MNTQIDVAALAQPFASELVKTRKGNHNQELSYVEAVHYVARLNEAFGGAWSFRILEKQVSGGEVVVRAEIEAGGVTKQAFGGAQVTTNKETGETVSLGDDMKAAATDALKKAASLFGVGLDLYGGTAKKPPRSNGTSNGNSGAAANGSGNGTVRNRLTAKQLRAIYAISHSQGMTDDELKTMSVEKFGVSPEFLNGKDASAFIDTLQAS